MALRQLAKCASGPGTQHSSLRGAWAALSTSRGAWASESSAMQSGQPSAPSTNTPAAAEQEDSPSTSGADQAEFVYKGPFATPHKRLKLVSLANTAVSLAASPLILWASDAPPLMRVGLAASIAGFGLFTTGALHWFSRPYVHELRYDPGSQELVAQTVTLLGGMRQHRFHIDDVTAPVGFAPLATFSARGKVFFLDKNAFADRELLERLTPVDPELAELQRAADAAKGRREE